ncbi:hypothetical protein D3P07_21495 [Paenibacillus sp. 1011MAR3C5]|nr:hypothetical protein D3P07_21495 [Paenibacillus sp. 1011MAR3C5]
MNKYFIVVAIFIMGFMLLHTPQLSYLYFSSIDIGLIVKRVLDILGLLMMLYGVYAIIRIWRKVNMNES